MDQAAILLGALRVKARRAGAQLSTADVEGLADAVGIDRGALPGLMAQLDAADAVKLVWGGVEVLAEPARTGGRVAIETSGPALGVGPTMTFGTEFTVGALAGAAEQLRALEPRLKGVAAESVREALAVLDARPGAEAAAELRQAWAARLMDALNELVRRAPESETVLELAERVQRAVGRG
ncbi:hypothetical protein [Elioraea sp.]|uniref:hypothetical protein n=1 Tax=Elioraea sp. TaxID=2185103 RepID=UPI003F6ED12C